ncbi:MAG TPA: ATP-dependent helicase HrpB [Kofleriaceae bacterium]|nr:ATP-dependent helicase HrpB [Kofleriaceae bacterium]
MGAPLPPLPIDDVLPQVVAAVRDRRVCVLVAAPGAGKTTRVPGALLDAGAVAGRIVVLQPRRIAARLAAARIAAERGGEVGGEVGYQVRFERRVGPDTRIELVTEGVLTRRILDDRELRGVGCVIVDEFHERHLEGDLALALVARLRERRPELALVVMSATLDAEPVAAFLQDAPIIRSEGRTFPLSIEHAAQPDDRPLPKQVASAVRRVLREEADGDVLVFLPGAGEIRRCADELADIAADVRPLHGELSSEEQDAAVRRSARRKVILATNVAETSVTIDGVTCVIDSGLARIARHSPWSGIPSLEIEPVSRASCAQRAGRAGRTRPGRVVRLYTKHDHDTRRAFEPPEIARADLAGAALELYGARLAGVRDLRWFEAPPAAAAEAADAVLARLGAIAAGAITELGRRMLRFPVHPRLARLLCEAEGRGVAREACAIAALLGARELRKGRRTARVSSPSDVIDDFDALHARDDIDRAVAYQVERAAKQLERIVDTRARPPSSDDAVDRELQVCILTAYPDRVGKRRAPRSAEIAFAGGGAGTLAPTSAVIDAELLVAVDVAETGARGQATRVQIRRASAIDPAWLLDLYLDNVRESDELVWNSDKERVERVQRMSYDGLAGESPGSAGVRSDTERRGVTIDESRTPAPADRAAAELLAKQALAVGIDRFVDADELAQWRARVALAARLAPDSGLEAPTDDALTGVLARACEGATSFAELRQLGLLALLDAQLGEHRTLVDRLAPTHLTLPRRRRAPIHYSLDQPPWLASRMQDFFGLARAPTVGDGRVPLVLHLLAPNQRPVQVTTDLPGFWVKHYPALRKQLARRYPRHAWPEDPTQLVDE